LDISLSANPGDNITMNTGGGSLVTIRGTLKRCGNREKAV
jgi:hypothetical protein